MTAAAPASAHVRGSAPHRAVLMAFLALGVTVGSWGARIPDVKAELDLGDGALGSALLGLSVGAVAGAWLGGLLVRHLGSRRVVTTGWLLVGLAIVPLGFVSAWGALAAALLVMGLAVGVLDVSMNGAGVQLEHEADEPLLSGLHAGWSGGVLIGAATGAVAVATDVPVDVHLLVVAAVVVGLGLVFGRRVPDGRIDPVDEAVHGEDGTTARRGRSRWRLAALAAVGGCVFLAEGALLDWAGVLVREDLDGGKLLGAVAVTGVSAGGLAGRLSGDRLAAAWGPPRLVKVGVAAATVAFVLCLVAPVAWPVPLLLAFVGAGLAPAVPLAFAAAGRLRGEHGIAVVTTAGYGAYLAGPGIIGALAHATDLRVALVLPLVLVAAVWTMAWSTSTD